MDIIYDAHKAMELKTHRGIDLAHIAVDILLGRFVADLKNPARKGQRLFIVKYKGYMHAVPFIYKDENTVVIKTAYAFRKYNAFYGRMK